MKSFKRINALVLSLAVTFTCFAGFMPASAAKNQKITVKVGTKKMSAAKKSYKVSGGYLLPAKIAAKAMGAKKVAYNKKKKTVTIKSGKTTLVYKVGTKKVTVNKKNKKTAVKTVIKNKVPYVDGKNLAKNLGYTKLTYNKKKKVLTITKPKKEADPTVAPTDTVTTVPTNVPTTNPTEGQPGGGQTLTPTQVPSYTPVAVITPAPVSISKVQPLEFECPVVDTTGVGHNIKKTMYKLRDGLPVTIALYGQSITSKDNKWTEGIKQYLERSYPQAEITWINLAVGGWGADRLVKCVEYDFRNVSPDLTIVYFYGSNQLYEQVIKTIRTKTSSEIMMLTEHKAGSESYEGIHKNLTATQYGTYWSDAMSYVLLPEIAKKYNCELADIRTYWAKYLEDNGKTKAYTSANNNNDIHLNNKGQSLMTHILKQYFVDVGYHGQDHDISNEEVRKLNVGYMWNNGTITIPFSGNHVEVVANSISNGSATIKIDGKSPSEYKELYYNTRITPDQDYYWGTLGTLKQRTFYGFDFTGIPTVQDITMTTQNTSTSNIGIKVNGSVSGDMGTFSSGITFGASGGDITFASPQTFAIDNGNVVGKFTNFRFEAALEDGLVFNTSIKLNGMDILITSAAGNYILASGLENTQHTLTITANDPNNLPVIDEIIIKRPPLGRK